MKAFHTACVVALLSAPLTHAVTLTQNDNKSQIILLTDVGAGDYSVSEPTFTIDKFDPSLGTLESIWFNGSASYQANFEFGATGGGFGASYAGTFVPGGVDNTLLQGGGGIGSGSGPGGIGSAFGAFNAPVNVVLTPADGALFDAFVGTGDLDIVLDGDYSITGLPSDATLTLRMDASYVSVDYVYTVPEPASATLALLAGAPVLLRRRRS